MDSESENDDESLSSMSDDDEIYEVALSQRAYSEEKPKFVTKYENDIDNLANIYMISDSDNEDRLADYSNDEFDEVKIVAQKKYTPRKDYTGRSDKWSPKIQSVYHLSPDSLEIKNEIEHLVLVKEDEIKQEEEFLNENDDQDHSENDFQKSIFAEYPNLKIKDEFNFTSCSIKLEKIDFSHISSTSFSEPGSPTPENTSEERSSRRTRTSRRSYQHQTPESTQQVPSRKILRKNKPKKKTTVRKSKKPSKATQKRKSSRIKRGTSAVSEDKTKKSTSQKSVKSSDDHESQKRANSSTTSKTRRASTAVSDDSDTELSLRKKSKKVRFMEAHGLKDRQEIPKSKTNDTNRNSSTPSTKSKRVTFADTVDVTLTKKDNPSVVASPQKVDVNGVNPPKKKVKDPADEYKRAIAMYSLDIDSYKKEFNSWFECLCCDRKFHLIEQCQAHVRGHFPGLLTN